MVALTRQAFWRADGQRQEKGSVKFYLDYSWALEAPGQEALDKQCASREAGDVRPGSHGAIWACCQAGEKL